MKCQSIKLRVYRVLIAIAYTIVGKVVQTLEPSASAIEPLTFVPKTVAA